MYKLLAVLSLIATITGGQAQQLNNSNDLNNYLNQNRAKYAQNIRDYDQHLETFQQSYIASLATSNVRLNFLINGLVENNKFLNGLKILNKVSQNCIKKYGSSIPTVEITKLKYNRCWYEAHNQVDSLLMAPRITRNTLDSYYKNNFERDITNCERQGGAIYESCVINAINNANSYTANNQKTFQYQMSTAQHNAKVNIQTALDCGYKTQKQTITASAEANTMIEKCLKGQDECKQCNNQGVSCQYISYIPRSEVNYNSLYMNNPFYQRYDLTDCLMLKIY